MATMYEADNSSNLYWVGAHFVFFLDIPWAEALRPLPRPLDASDTLQGPLQSSTPVHALTVGLLEEIMDCPVPVESLLQMDESGHAILSGDRLAESFVPWAHKRYADARLPDGEASALQWGERVKTALTKATALIQHDVWPRIRSMVDHSLPDADFLCTVIVFLSSLSAAVFSILYEKVNVLQIVNKLHAYPEILHVLRRRIKSTWGERNGDAQAWLDAGFPFIAYMSTCEPTIVRVASSDPETYRPEHCLPDCDCPHIIPSFDRVAQLLSNGDIPVMVWNGSEIVVRGASEGPYVAISHVWADGMGSTTESGLPRCQVARLSDRVRQLVPDGAFWVDSLCVPAAPELRQREIVMMSRTFGEADKVLVVDGAVRTQCSLSSPKEECALRIGTSGWMQRIWTLPEGMLARELYFEVSDGLIDLTFFDGAPFRLAQVMIPLARHRARDEGARQYQKRAATSPNSTRYSVNDLVSLLRYRSASRPEDEPIAVSGLLGVDVSKIVEFKTGEERMKALLIEVGTLNRQIGIYGWTCDRLSLPNFGWAPRSLSEVIWAGDPSDDLVAICTDEGLLADYCVLRFPTAAIGLDCGIVAVLGAGNAMSEGSPAEGDSCSECGAPGDATRVLNITLSPHPYKDRGVDTVLVNGVIMKHSVGHGRLRDDGVAAVMIDELSSQLAPLRCKFIACGSVTTGFPITVETRRSRTYWAHVPTTELPLQQICLV